MKIGLLVIATGKYISFVEQFRDSAEKYFFKNTPAKVSIFVFTDSPIVPNRIIKLHKEHKKFPYPTLTRYHTFYKYRKKLSQMDYLFYCDVDMRFVAPVGKEILSDLTATLHPGFYNKPRSEYTYENRRESAAFISFKEGMHYFCGGFNGGSAKSFLSMSKTVSANIDRDKKNNLIAVWHDESHLNRYLIDHPPTLILSPSYCYQEELRLPFSPKLVALKKNHEHWRYSGLEEIYQQFVSNLVRLLGNLRHKIRFIPFVVANLRLKFMCNYPEIWLQGFYGKKLKDTHHFIFSHRLAANAIDLVVVAFNNPQMIETQIRFLHKNLQDKFYYTVADNSNDPAARQEIEKICRQKGASYVSLPNEPFGNIGSLGSLSHGAAMTWMYRNFLSTRATKYFGFLDHDIFPFRKTSLLKFFSKSPIFGAKQFRSKIWYLWAGFCFFSKDFVADKPLNFLSGKIGSERVDTGGSNWAVIYRHIHQRALPNIRHRYLNLTGGKIAQHDWVEFFGDWLHLFNASNWYRMDSVKAQQRGKALAKLLRKYDC